MLSTSRIFRSQLAITFLATLFSPFAFASTGINQNNSGGCSKTSPVPNPHPVPNETTEFYGVCDDHGNGYSGWVIWLQAGKKTGLSCLIEGNYESSLDKTQKACSQYINQLPNGCKDRKNHILRDVYGYEYFGQCVDGKYEGVGNRRDMSGDANMYMGGFKNGKYHGMGTIQHGTGCFGGSCGSWSVMTGIFENGVLKRECANLQDCKNKEIEAVRAATAKQQQERRFNELLISGDPQGMYIAAGKYENDGERGVAKAIYNKIVERFPKHPLAIKAIDRLTRLSDVESVESSNRNAANQVESAHNQSREAAYQQCMNNYSACYSSCDNLRDSSSRNNCKSGCATCTK